MSKYRPVALGNLTAVATGTAVDVNDLENVGMSVTGTFVLTAKLMISFDGTEYVQFGADFTAPGSLGPLPRCKKLRLDCSAFTSGTAKGRVGGGDVNR